MSTIFEALQWAQEEIKSTSHEQVNKPNAMIEAQMLLRHVLDVPAAHLFSHFSDYVAADKLNAYTDFVKRRAAHEPIAYILGEKGFYGRDFVVTADVLIPRPETELLVEAAMEIIDEDTAVLDVGTGSGAIGITLVKEVGCEVVASDVSVDALTVARRNAERLKAADKIRFLEGSLLEPFFASDLINREHKTMVICANLPYVKIDAWPSLDPDVRQFEPKKAIVGGADGLDFYRELLGQISARREIFPRALFVLMEIDPGQELGAPRMVEEVFPGAIVDVREDMSKRARLVVVRC